MSAPTGTTQRIHLGAAYFVDDSSYINAGRGSSARTQRIYWRNIAVMFASALRVFPASTRFVLFTNAEPPADVARVLDRIGVSLVTIPFEHRPPSGYYGTYNGAFYLLDAITHLVRSISDGEVVVLSDPDCVWVADPAPMVERLRDEGVIGYECDYPPDQPVPGVTRLQLADMYQEIDEAPVDVVPPYFGGELCGFTHGTIGCAADLLDVAWRDSMQRFRDGRNYMTTEEPMLSYALWRMGLQQGNANDFVQRLWTSVLYRTVSRDPRSREFSLLLWHLPAEKKRGLLRLYESVADLSGPFWTLAANDFKTYVAESVGIIRTPSRRADDAWRRRAVLTKRLGRTAMRQPSRLVRRQGKRTTAPA